MVNRAGVCCRNLSAFKGIPECSTKTGDSGSTAWIGHWSIIVRTTAWLFWSVRPKKHSDLPLSTKDPCSFITHCVHLLGMFRPSMKNYSLVLQVNYQLYNLEQTKIKSFHYLYQILLWSMRILIIDLILQQSGTGLAYSRILLSVLVFGMECFHIYLKKNIPFVTQKEYLLNPLVPKLYLFLNFESIFKFCSYKIENYLWEQFLFS